MKAIPSCPKQVLRLLVLQMGLWLCHSMPAAVDFTVTPSSVSNTYGGDITLRVTGLAGSQTVVVQKFLDANTNDVIDGPDLLWQQFPLTDGQANVIGGITNINVPGDTDSTSGQITARVIFQNGDPGLNVIGKYALKLSSPTGAFTPITNSFTITNTGFAQSLTGNVVGNGTNIPNAVVLVFQAPRPGDNGPGWTLAGTVANNSGGYSVKLPAGSYALAALKSNYLTDLTSLPVTLGSGATVSHDIRLTNATRSISGKLADAANNSIGLPGLFIHAVSDGMATAGTTDTNGNFTLRVGPGLWDLGASDMESLGYLGLGSDTGPIDTTTGNVSGLVITYPKATALFYGSVKDSLNQPLAGVFIFSGDENELYDVNSFTDTNGNYVTGVLGGAVWNVQVDNDQPIQTRYLFSAGLYGTNLSSGQAVRQDFTAILATNHITGHLQDNDGNPLTNIEVYANAFVNSKNYFSQAVTDANGNYSLLVANGSWSMWVCCGCDGCNRCLGSAYCCPTAEIVNISNADAVRNLTASGLIATAPQLPVGNVDDFYSLQFTAAACVSNPTWSATNPPSGLDLAPDGILSGVPDTAGSNYFFVRLDSPGGSATKAVSLVINPAPGSQPQLGQPTKPSPSQFRFLLTGIVGQNYTIQKSTNLSTTNWSVLFITNAPATSIQIIDPTATNARAFYRALLGP